MFHSWFLLFFRVAFLLLTKFRLEPEAYVTHLMAQETEANNERAPTSIRMQMKFRRCFFVFVVFAFLLKAFRYMLMGVAEGAARGLFG